jgi:L-fuconolactonase
VSRVIDAHVHIWRRSRAKYAWMGADDLAPIRRDHTLSEALEEVSRFGVDEVILVQAADEIADTVNMLEESAGNPRVAGIVGWLPLDEPAVAKRSLESMVGSSRLVGVRSLIHDRTDTDWIVSQQVADGLALLEDTGLAFDFVTATPSALVHVPTLARRHPNLRIVIDHLGKPSPDSSLGEWRALLATAAKSPNVYAKVSGLVPVDGVRYREIVAAAAAAFGFDRLMYGGDWPMVDLVGGYAAWWAALTPTLASIGGVDRARLLGGTAEEFYQLPVRKV